MRGLRLTLKGVREVGFIVTIGSFDKRSSSFVVWNIALPRVGEQWQDSGDFPRRSGLAGRDGDEQLHEVVIDLSTARLYDIDIFPTHGFFDLNSSLAD